MRHGRHIATALLGLALVAGVPCTHGVVTLADPPSTDDDVYAPPDRPLDPRIPAGTLTEHDPPRLPEDVLLPLPPDHRIATNPVEVPIDEARWKAANEAIVRGVAALRASQLPTGGWMREATVQPTGHSTGPEEAPPSPVSSSVGVAVTALAVRAIVQSGAADDDVVEDLRRALRYIDRARAADGSYAGGALTNYVTATVVSALTSVDEFEFREEIRGGITWLQDAQWDQSEGLAAQQDWFGGAGYGKHGRPDLSNTQMMLEAMYDAGLSPAEPAFQRALAFVSRTQNLPTNPAEWAGRDGGFIYTPVGGGESMASEHAGEGRFGEKLPPGAPRSLRSYGSMTYAGFKSFLYAGLSPDDVRVRAAFDWIRRHWTFDENPGLGEQGLYYYYHAMTRAMRVAQQHHVTDIDGVSHNWREELIDAIVRRQAPDGTWRNPADRWLEGEPDMATVYALLALEEALKPVSMLSTGE